MNNTKQPYCQLETMSNLLMQIKGARPVTLHDYDPSFHGVGIQVDGMDYMTILFERNGLDGVRYDVDGDRSGRTWRRTNCSMNGVKDGVKDGKPNYEFLQRTEDEFCAEVVKEVNETRLNCA
jgi:hypothetical protein